MQIAKDRLCELIPHSGNMCLLSEVLTYDDEGISCLSDTHLKRDNPLRDDDGLACINAVEYAAQAIAIHSALKDQDDADSAKSSSGYLVQVKNIKFENIDLSQLSGAITISATQVFSTPTSLVYNFLINDQARYNDSPLMSGRIMIFMTEST